MGSRCEADGKRMGGEWEAAYRFTQLTEPKSPEKFHKIGSKEVILFENSSRSKIKVGLGRLIRDIGVIRIEDC